MTVVIAGDGGAVTGTTSGDSITVPRPSGIANGDLLVVMIVDQGSAVTGDYTCSGWTRVGPAFVASSSGQRVTDMYYRQIPTASADTATSDTFTCAGTGGRKAAICLRLTGVDPASPVLAAGTAYQDIAATPTISAPATTAAGLMLAWAQTNYSSPTASTLTGISPSMTNYGFYTTPTGATSTVSRTNLAVWSAPATSATAATTYTVTYGAAPSQYSGSAVAFRAATAVPPPAGTPGVTIWTGTSEVPAVPRIWSGTTEQPAQTPTLSIGDTTVSTLLATVPPLYCAHRGGGNNWPEMTMRAYDSATMGWHLRAIEISVWATSDGVLVCSHDQNTSRVTGQSFDIPTTPWATLAPLMVSPSATTNTSQPSVPFARLTDVLARYASGPGPVIFIEDKPGTNTPAILSLLQTYPNWQNRFVWKCYGLGGNSVTLGHNAGLKTWGYYFLADMPSLAPANYSRFDLLGADYNCSDAQVQSIVALAPTIGHIITTTTQRDRMLSLGCIGIMASDVMAVVPRK